MRGRHQLHSVGRQHLPQQLADVGVQRRLQLPGQRCPLRRPHLRPPPWRGGARCCRQLLDHVQQGAARYPARRRQEGWPRVVTRERWAPGSRRAPAACSGAHPGSSPSSASSSPAQSHVAEGIAALPWCGPCQARQALHLPLCCAAGDVREAVLRSPNAEGAGGRGRGAASAMVAIRSWVSGRRYRKRPAESSSAAEASTLWPLKSSSISCAPGPPVN